MKFYYNGELRDENSNYIPVKVESNLWRGEGWFETLALHEDKLLNLSAHLERLKYTLPDDLMNDISWDSLCRDLAYMTQENHRKNGRAKIVAWEQSGGLQVAAWISDYDPPAKSAYREGIGLELEYRSHPPRWPVTDEKRTSYAAELERRHQTDAWDVLYCDLEGCVWETGIANIMWWNEDRLVTPPFDGHILVGTVLRKLLEAASDLGIEIEYRNAEWSNITQWTWVTNSLIGCLPVAKIGDRRIDTQNVPESWKQLQEKLLSDSVIPNWY